MTRDEPGTEDVRDGLYAYYSVRSGLGYEYAVAALEPRTCPAPDGTEDFRHDWQPGGDITRAARVGGVDLFGTDGEVCQKCGLMRRWAP